MSVINKKPYIQKVIESLSQENLEDLQALVNGATSTLFRSFINPSYVFTEEDKGVAHCVLETPDDVYTGYLIYTDTYCVLVCYNGDKTQKMFTLKLDYENKKYSIVDEDLNINEFRRIVENHITNLEVDNNDVVANPTLVGTEANLTGLQVGENKYKIPEKHLYLHKVTINFNKTITINGEQVTLGFANFARFVKSNTESISSYDDMISNKNYLFPATVGTRVKGNRTEKAISCVDAILDSGITMSLVVVDANNNIVYIGTDVYTAVDFSSISSSYKEL